MAPWYAEPLPAIGIDMRARPPTQHVQAMQTIALATRFRIRPGAQRACSFLRSPHRPTNNLYLHKPVQCIHLTAPSSHPG